MQPVAPIVHEQSIEINFPNPDFMPDPLLRLSQADLGYSTNNKQAHNKIVLKAVNTSVRAGSRIGELGMNGAGKSTFVKSLAGYLSLLAAGGIAAQSLIVVYFAQHQLDMLDMKGSSLLHMQRVAPEQNEQVLRNYLGRFGFKGTMALD